MGRAGRGPLLRQSLADHRQDGVPGRAVKDKWGKAFPAERALVLLRIADRIEEKLCILAQVETIDNGKPIRETTLADLPLAVEHLR